MPSSLTPTCSLCGLRFASSPLLELHIREDHSPRRHPAQAGQGDRAGPRPSRPHPGGPGGGHGQAASPSRTRERTTMTGTRSPRRPHTGWTMTALRRVIGAFRRVNAELRLASEVMFRPVGAPRPRHPEEPPAGQDTHPTATSGRAGRAA